MMAVMSKRSTATMTQKQEEQTYCQFIEDFLNYSFMKQVGADGDSYPNMLLLVCIPQLMHGAFISQPMQVKILMKVKEITSGISTVESSPLAAVKDNILNLVQIQITKIENSQKAQRIKEEKKAQPKAKAADLKALKGKSAIGKKRTYADKIETHNNG